jgi:hypothetical protein
MKPTIYLTNLARASAVRVGRSARFAGEVGPGPVLGIMRWPPAWARVSGLTAGHVVSLMPTVAELTAAKSGAVAFEDYRRQLLARWGKAARAGVYQPAGTGQGLRWAVVASAPDAEAVPPAAHWDGSWWAPAGHVPDGATLCCACDEARGCHRSVAAEVLSAAGWAVVLDGEEVG